MGDCRLGLGFSEYGQANCKQKCGYYTKRSRVQERGAFTVLRNPRNLAASRLLVQNSSMPDEDSVVLRVRSGDDLHGVPPFQFSSLNGDAADTSKVCFPSLSSMHLSSLVR